jgi:hypothetical protein
LNAILRADLFFAWIVSPDCFGTLVEIGFALRANKHIVVATPFTLDVSDHWFGVGVQTFLRAESATTALRFVLEGSTGGGFLPSEPVVVVCGEGSLSKIQVSFKLARYADVGNDEEGELQPPQPTTSPANIDQHIAGNISAMLAIASQGDISFDHMRTCVLCAAPILTIPVVMESLKSVAGVQKAKDVPPEKYRAVVDRLVEMVRTRQAA